MTPQNVYLFIFCSTLGAAAIALSGLAIGRKIFKKKEQRIQDMHWFI